MYGPKRPLKIQDSYLMHCLSKIFKHWSQKFRLFPLGPQTFVTALKELRSWARKALWNLCLFETLTLSIYYYTISKTSILQLETVVLEHFKLLSTNHIVYCCRVVGWGKVDFFFFFFRICNNTHVFEPNILEKPFSKIFGSKTWVLLNSLKLSLLYGTCYSKRCLLHVTGLV